jgi:predicted dehydrogenase
MSRPSASRREFLKTGAAAAAAASVPYFCSTASTMAQEAKVEIKTDRPILGCIGTGDRWNAVGPQAMNFADCVAVCDVDSNHAEKGKAKALEQNAKKGRERTVEVYEDYRKLLDRKDIEVVTIVTPDHWHSKIAIEAMKAGKDVYCEKPLTLTIDEGRQILKVLKETGRVFQVGTQQRSEMSARVNRNREQRVDQQFLVAVALAKLGRLGQIKTVRACIGGAPSSGEIPKAPVPSNLNWNMWLGQAPMTDYLQGGHGNNKNYPESRTHYEFRWWYEYSGGKMTDWGAHHIDISQWAMGMDTSGPLSVEGTAEHPVPFKDGYPTVSNRYNTATSFHITAAFPKDMVLHVVSQGENGITIEGTDATIFVSRGDLRDEKGTVVADMLKGSPLPEGTITRLYKGKKPGNHMANFFECTRDRTQPISDVATHHRTMTTAHLANIAIRLGRKLTWDAAKEQIVGDEEANRWQKREQRKGFEIVA